MVNSQIIILTVVVSLFFGSLLVQTSYSDANFYTDVKLQLEDTDYYEQTNTGIIQLEIELTNNGDEKVEISATSFILFDKNKRQYSNSYWTGLLDCPSFVFESVNPHVTEEFNVCFEVTKKEWLDYYLILYSGLYDLCGNTYYPCTYTKRLDIPEITLVSSTGPTVKDKPTTSQSQDTLSPTVPFGKTRYSIYADDLPSWVDFAGNAVYEATEAWKEINPELEFYIATTPQQADFVIQWVKDFGGEQHIGYAIGSQFIEIGLGDSNCRGNWHPYSSDYVALIMMHEIGHILGHEHSSDPKSIMYPIAQSVEYGIVEEEFTLTENYAQFVPFCTVKDLTSFSYVIESDEPTYGFDVYVVPSKNELNQFIEGKSIKHYTGSGCFVKNMLSYGDTCEGVSQGSGILVTMPDTLTNPLTKITVSQQEVPFTTGLLQKTTSVLDQSTEPIKHTKILTSEDCYFSKTTTGRSSGTLEIPNGGKIYFNFVDGIVSTVTLDCYSLIFDIEITNLADNPRGRLELSLFPPNKDQINSFTISEINIKNGKGLYPSSSSTSNTSNSKEISIYIQGRATSIEVIGALWNLYDLKDFVIDPAIQERHLESKIPDWIRNNAQWWAEGAISDGDFTTGIQYLIKEGIIQIPKTVSVVGGGSDEIPEWVKNIALWYGQGIITADEFLEGIQYLVEQGIIVLKEPDITLQSEQLEDLVIVFILDEDSYSVGQDAVITLMDPRLDQKQDEAEFYDLDRITVKVNGNFVGTIRDWNPAPFHIRETGDSTGIFQVVIEIMDTIGNTKIQVGDVIEFEYEDVLDSSGNALTVSVSIDVIA